MKIEKFVLGPVGTNCYIVRNDDTMECFIVDMAACPPEFVSHIRNSGLTVKAVSASPTDISTISWGLTVFWKNFRFRSMRAWRKKMFWKAHD